MSAGGPADHKYQYSINIEEPKNHSCACMKWIPEGCSHADGKYGELLGIIEQSVNESLEGEADVKATWFDKDRHFSYEKKVTCDNMFVDLVSNKEIDVDDLYAPVVNLFQKMDELAEASSYEPGIEGYISAYKDNQAENDFAAAVDAISQTDSALEQ